MLEGKLLEAGLLPNEAKIYVSLLNLGKSNLSKIATIAKINHVTAYYNLQSLVKKNLVIKQTENKQKYYYIKNPKHGLKQYLQLLDEEYDKKKTAIHESIDGAEIKYSSLTNRPEVKFLEGNDVSRQIQLEIMNTEYDELFEFTNLDESYKFIPKQSKTRKNIAKEFNVHKIKRTTIYTSSLGICFPKKHKRKTSYYIPKEEYTFPGEIALFGDKVILLSFNPSEEAVVIKNKSISQTLRNLFKLAIIGTKKYNQVQ